jgi:Mn-dependent DtxR family transcriptional regulator
MEHALSRESINRLEKFIDFVMDCHPGRPDWEDIFNRYIKQGKDDREIQARFAREA